MWMAFESHEELDLDKCLCSAVSMPAVRAAFTEMLHADDESAFEILKATGTSAANAHKYLQKSCNRQKEVPQTSPDPDTCRMHFLQQQSRKVKHTQAPSQTS